MMLFPNNKEPETGYHRCLLEEQQQKAMYLTAVNSVGIMITPNLYTRTFSSYPKKRAHKEEASRRSELHHMFIKFLKIKFFPN
jgi:hypothetical protein